MSWDPAKASGSIPGAQGGQCTDPACPRQVPSKRQVYTVRAVPTQASLSASVFHCIARAAPILPLPSYRQYYRHTTKFSILLPTNVGLALTTKETTGVRHIQFPPPLRFLRRRDSDRSFRLARKSHLNFFWCACVTSFCFCLPWGQNAVTHALTL